MEPFSGTLKNSDCWAFGLFETVPRNLILSVQLQSVDNGAICSLKAKLIFDISKQTSENLNKFERTFRWKFCEKVWLPDTSSILEGTWLQGIWRLILKLEKMIVIDKMYFYVFLKSDLRVFFNIFILHFYQNGTKKN